MTPYRHGDLIDGRYRLLRALGQGGMGQVFEAEHVVTRRHVALKLLHGFRDQSTAVQRFQREARMLGALSSRYIVQVLDAGIDRESGSPYMALEQSGAAVFNEELRAAVARG